MKRPTYVVLALVILGALGLIASRASAATNRHEGRGPEPSPLDKSSEHSGRTLEVLTSKVLTQRSLDTFPAGYLTLVSIIQGVALASLATEAVALMASTAATRTRFEILGEAAAVFTAILVVSYEYLWFTTVMRWPTTLRDTVIPYVLGLGEIMLPLLMQWPRAWTVAVACFVVTGAGAYLNTYVRCQLPMFATVPAAHRILRQLLQRLLIMCIPLLSAYLAASACAIFAPSRFIHTFDVYTPWALVVLAAVMVVPTERALNAFYAIYDVPRRPSATRNG